MKKASYHIDQNINEASTLPGSFYRDQLAWDRCKEKIFLPSWQYLGHKDELFEGNHNVKPITLLKEYFEEYVLLVKDNERIRCLSNVCTHRGYILVNQPGRLRKITCGYHGRRFDLNGQFEFMPEFDETLNFPRSCDHLPELKVFDWQGHLFTSIAPTETLDGTIALLNKWVGFLPVSSFRYVSEHTKTYSIQAHWALYVDNYLEGFHIPFVHDALNAILDYRQYTTKCFDRMVLQIGYSDGAHHTLDLPANHPEYGKEVTAMYFWIYPNFMLNFYPWGLQVNRVRPIEKGMTEVDFWYFISDSDLFNKMQGPKLGHQTEMEDEKVVEGVFKGLGSRLYTTGRFSPKREMGVHHFHQMIAQSLRPGSLALKGTRCIK